MMTPPTCAYVFSTNATRMFKLCLFSPVQGIVVHNGQPVVGAVIERTCEWEWKDVEHNKDQVVTDEKGAFSLPGIYSWMGLVQLIPHQPVIYQHIIIKHDGKDYCAWHYTKMEYGEYKELEMEESLGDSPGLGGKPIDLLCDLGAELKSRGGYGGIAELLSNHATISQS